MENKESYYKPTNYSSFMIEVDLNKMAKSINLKEANVTRDVVNPFHSYTSTMSQVIRNKLGCNVGVILEYNHIKIEISDDSLISSAKEYAYKTLDMFPSFLDKYKGDLKLSKEKVDYLEKLIESTTQKEALDDSLIAKDDTEPSVKKKFKV